MCPLPLHEYVTPNLSTSLSHRTETFLETPTSPLVHSLRPYPSSQQYIGLPQYLPPVYLYPPLLRSLPSLAPSRRRPLPLSATYLQSTWFFGSAGSVSSLSLGRVGVLGRVQKGSTETPRLPFLNYDPTIPFLIPDSQGVSS